MANQQYLEDSKKRLTEVQLELEIAEAEYELAMKKSVIMKEIEDLKTSLSSTPFASTPSQETHVKVEMNSCSSPILPRSPLATHPSGDVSPEAWADARPHHHGGGPSAQQIGGVPPGAWAGAGPHHHGGGPPAQ